MRALDLVLHPVPNRKLRDTCVFTLPAETQQVSEPFKTAGP